MWADTGAEAASVSAIVTGLRRVPRPVPAGGVARSCRWGPAAARGPGRTHSAVWGGARPPRRPRGACRPSPALAPRQPGPRRRPAVPEPAVVFGQAGRLQIAVRNLLDNAAKFGSQPGSLGVEVRLAAGELTVRDHGPGIAPGDLPHVFDRFYRAPSARGIPGSGLGLCIVRQVAESHGGTVQAEPAPGGGTLIRFR